MHCDCILDTSFNQYCSQQHILNGYPKPKSYLISKFIERRK